MNVKTIRFQLILFIAISYAYLWLLFGVGTLFDIAFSYDFREPGGVLVLCGIPASLFAASLVTLITSGKDALYRLFTHTLDWRFNPIWCLSALLTPLIVAFVSGMAGWWSNDFEMTKPWFSPSMPLGFMAFLLIYIGFGEEIGWRGFTLPRFQHVFGSFWGSIVTGIFWALWHLPLFFMPGSSQYGQSLPLFIYLLTCWTIPMAVFVSKANGSVIPAILFHLSVNFLAFSIHFPYRFFYFFWGLTAIIALPFLPKSPTWSENRSAFYPPADD